MFREKTFGEDLNEEANQGSFAHENFVPASFRISDAHQSERRQEDPIMLQLDVEDTVVEDLEDD